MGEIEKRIWMYELVQNDYKHDDVSSQKKDVMYRLDCLLGQSFFKSINKMY